MTAIQSFGLGEPIASADPTVLGGKGAGLVWMTSMNIRVPPGFVIPTSYWEKYKAQPKATMKALAAEIKPYLEKLTKVFGYMPLLSVRSGARVSCPGMMDTILNVGLCDANTGEWDKRLGKACVNDSYKRLIEMYCTTALGLSKEQVSHELVPQDPMAQILGAVEAVLKSWDNDRAKFYRKLNNIPDEWGTACVIQAMVFGNMDDQSGTGVLFTRDPDTGLGKIKGEFLVNAQGEDVVAGVKTPMPLEQMSNWNDAVYQELQETVLKLEQLKSDVQDVEFTVQHGVLYVLQTRTAKRSGRAALKIALDMLDEGMIPAQEVVRRVRGRDLDNALQPTISPDWKTPAKYHGLPACSGVAKGRMVFSTQEVLEAKDPVILVAEETTPEDIQGMHKAVGVLTMTGGYTSHAAVVARGMNRACVVALGQPLEELKAYHGQVTMDGASGRLWFEDVPVTKGMTEARDRFHQLLLEVHQFSPVIFSAPKSKMPRAWLHLGLTQLDAAKAVQMIAQAAKTVDDLMVDFTLTNEHEQTMGQMFGLCEKDVQEIVGLVTAQNVTFVTQYKVQAKVLPVLNDLQTTILHQGPALQPIGATLTPAMEKLLQLKAGEIEWVSLGKPGSSGAFCTFEQAYQVGNVG